MQISLLSDVTVNCESIIAIEPPVEFDCVVEGKKLKAKITHQEDNGIQFIYHIAFSDGHTASFVASIQGGTWNDGSFASAYAKAIHDDLNAFCGFVPRKPPIAIRLKGEQGAFNVWVVPHVFKPQHYYVFYKGDYRFEVRKTKVWEAKTVREGTVINQEIAAIVCKNVEQRLLQPQLL